MQLWLYYSCKISALPRFRREKEDRLGPLHGVILQAGIHPSLEPLQSKRVDVEWRYL